MNEDRIAGTWKVLKGKILEQWGNLTDDDVDKADGKWEQLSGTIQQKYGRTKDLVEKEIALFRMQHEQAEREQSK